jgi:hypothetical protein
MYSLPKTGFESLSPRRQRILRQILPQVVPSVYGDATFKKIDANWKPGSGYTTCGGLPSFVAQSLGVSKVMKDEGMGAYALTGMRNAAIRRGAWVHTGRSKRNPDGFGGSDVRPMPKPGDLYLLCSGGGHDFGCCTVQKVKDSDPWPKVRGATVEHVGVIVDVTGTLWTTADAGQSVGTSQAALYVRRHYNPVTNYLTGEQAQKGRPLRRLCGWVDVDRYPFLDGMGRLGALPMAA